MYVNIIVSISSVNVGAIHLNMSQCEGILQFNLHNCDGQIIIIH